MADKPSPYERTDKQGPFRQGEIITSVPDYLVSSKDDGGVDVQVLNHPYAIIVTQDCDLEQDFRLRAEKKMNHFRVQRNLLLCEVWLASDVRQYERDGDTFKANRALWGDIQKNKDERFCFLEEVPADIDLAGEGLPELVVHLRATFSILTEEAYSLASRGSLVRRCKLRSPYLEHLSQRVAGYLCRVALPEPHRSV